MHPSLSGLHSNEVRRRQSETAAKYGLMQERHTEDKPKLAQQPQQPKLSFLNLLSLKASRGINLWNCAAQLEAGKGSST
jgi:hypothetical protein